MLTTFVVTSFMAAGVASQFSFTIWDWEPAYRDIEFFKRQVDTVADYGVNTIELGISWRDCETSDGVFDFSIPDERVAYARSKALKLRLRINVTDWPEWFDPEFFQNPDGATFDYCGGLPSVFNAQNRKRQLRFAAAVAERYTGKGFTYTPAFSVHMEVKFGAWNTYEPSARAAFRNWLAGRFATIASLNETWGASYASFGEIEPPVPENTSGGPSTDAACADWIRFREAALTDWVTGFAAVIRKHDPAARISVPLGESFRSESAAFANLAYWNYSRPADEIVHSYDFFMHGPEHIDDIALATEIMRGITQRPTIIEIDGPILVEKLGYTTDSLVNAAQYALDRGAEGVQVTNWGSADLSGQAWLRAIGDECKLKDSRNGVTLSERGPWYYVSKWENYCVRDPNATLFERQFATLREMRKANMRFRIVTDENLLNEEPPDRGVFIPSGVVMDNDARDRLRSISLGSPVIAATKPGIFTPAAKTNGNFGAKIEIIEPAAMDDAIAKGTLPYVSDDAPRVLRVAAVQFHTCFDVVSNTNQIVDWIGKAADAGARVAVFSEMALTGYTKSPQFRDTLDWNVIDASIESIKKVCDARDMYAIVGAPTRDGDAIYCAALAIDPGGAIIDRYEKTYLAGEAWATPGTRFTMFDIDGATSGTFICHDERYPHLVQLRALAGAQLFFYISCESGIGDEHKIGPYRAQLQARAAENGVYIVHANAPALRENPNADGTSNGHSRIIGPDGNLIREAGPYEDTMVIADLDMRHAREAGMPAALKSGPTATWIQDGVKLVTRE